MEWRVWITWWITFVSDIQHYFEYTDEGTDNPSLRIYINKIEKEDYIWNKDRILSLTFNAWNNEITWKH